jgi:DNA-binding SARP family transcriptional activator
MVAEGCTMTITDATQESRAAAEAAGARTARDVYLNLLGGFELWVDGELVRIPEGSERLVVFVALRERPQPRLLVAGSLWPEKSDQRALANLRSSLWRCRLDDGYSVVVPDRNRLRLAAGVRLDVAEMETTGWALLKQPDLVSVDEVNRRLFYEELLPGWYDDWVIMERERLAQVQAQILPEVAASLCRAGRRHDAVDLEIRGRYLRNRTAYFLDRP